MTLLTDLKLITIWLSKRYSGSEMMRVSMINYGYIYYVIFIPIIVLILKINIKFKKIMYYASILMVLTVFITLTRQTIMAMILGSLFVILFTCKSLNIIWPL